METFLMLNGHEVEAAVDQQERMMLDVASGAVDRAGLADWLHGHTEEIG